MKVLFLDMDGVVNGAVFFKVQSKRGWRRALGVAKAASSGTQAIDDYHDRQLAMIDPEAVRWLSKVWEATDCKVVISSSWRVPHNYKRIEEWLRCAGWTAPVGTVIGATPYQRLCPDGAECNKPHEQGEPEPKCWGRQHNTYCGRGHEIKAWLDEHPEVTSYAIVDDSNDMGMLSIRLVQTTWAYGLQEHHVSALIVLLGKKELGK